MGTSNENAEMTPSTKTHRQSPCLLSSTSCSSSRNSSDWIVLSRDMITSPMNCQRSPS